MLTILPPPPDPIDVAMGAREFDDEPPPTEPTPSAARPFDTLRCPPPDVAASQFCPMCGKRMAA